MNENCGSQDQIWASYGGFNSIRFFKKQFKVNKIKISDKKLKSLCKNFFLIYTGINKFSNIIEKDKLVRFDKNIRYLDQIHQLAKEFKSQITNTNNFSFVGDIMNDYWDLKKNLSKKVTNYKINEIYKEALNCGASGGKIIGSGGGGFLLVYCKKKFHNKLRKKLFKLPIIKFDFVKEGSQIIFRS